MITIKKGQISNFHITDVHGGYASFKGEQPYCFWSEAIAPGFEMEDMVLYNEENLPEPCKKLQLPTKEMK